MKTLGKYEILDELGTGSMGTVYRAHDTVIDREIALKTIRTGIEAEPEMRERFYREARSCGRLQHPNIVTIYDLGEEAKTAYIAMELLQGQDFRKLLDQRRELPITRKLELIAQVCDALGHAHRHGVIHRDVKPSNLFLLDSGSVKVLDFGIARLTSSRLTVAGKILGTPNYMAPEQILANVCDGRADLFSVGVVFFELLVYQHPFRGGTIPQRIVETEPDSLFDYQSDLPPILEKVFARALAKVPEDRYPNAAAFASDLRAVLDSLRNPGSPSLVDLPSSRMETVVTTSGEETSFAPLLAPAGEDSAEWRNSEVLMLLPRFETAIEQNDAASAKVVYENLLQVVAMDARYAEAIASCRARLEQLGTPPLSGPKLKAAISPATQKICMECGSQNRGAARFCIGCGANLDETVAIAETEKEIPVPPAAPFGTGFDETSIYTPEPVPPPQEVKRSPQSGNTAPMSSRASQIYAECALWIQANRRYVVPASVVLLVIAIVFIGLVIRPTPIKLEQAVATATVQGQSASVYQAQSSTSKRLYTIDRTASVHIVKLPDSPSQEWVSVQPVIKGEAKAAGFTRRRDLGPLTGINAQQQIAIVHLMHPEENDETVAALRNLADKYPGTPEAITATAEGDRLNAKLHPAPPQEVTCDSTCQLGKAEELLNTGKDEKSRFDEPEEIVKKVLAEEPGNRSATQMLGRIVYWHCALQVRQADSLWFDGKLDEAESKIGECLSKSPNNVEANKTRDKIRRAREK